MKNRIGIIGGGASGVILALHLLRYGNRNSDICIFEPSAELGRGRAYEKSAEILLLNTPVEKMSLYEEDPLHFLRWVEKFRKDLIQSENFPFVPRTVYGDYLQHELLIQHHGIRHIRGVVSALRSEDGGELMVECGDIGKRFDFCCIATGFGRSESRSDSGRILSQCERFPGELHILGTGLSAIDHWMILRSFGYEGPIHFHSKSGAFPFAHLEKNPSVPDFAFAVGRSAKEVFRIFRKALNQTGLSEQELADGFRKVAKEIWWRWTNADKKLFLRHFRSYWQKIRHRMPPKVFENLSRELRSGRIFLHKVGEPFQENGGKHFLRATGFPVDCSPFRYEPHLLQPCRFGLGLESRWQNLEVLGPPRLGKDGEAGSIPEIRKTASIIAKKWILMSEKKPSPETEMAGISMAESAIRSQYS